MTNKAQLGLALVAMNQLDIVWDKNLNEIIITQFPSSDMVEIARVRTDYSLTRHTTMLEKALEIVVDRLGQGLKY